MSAPTRLADESIRNHFLITANVFFLLTYNIIIYLYIFLSLILFYSTELTIFAECV